MGNGFLDIKGLFQSNLKKNVFFKNKLKTKNLDLDIILHFLNSLKIMKICEFKTILIFFLGVIIINFKK